MVWSPFLLLDSLQLAHLSRARQSDAALCSGGRRSHLPCSGPYTSTDLVEAPSQLLMAILLSVRALTLRPLSHTLLSGLDSLSRHGVAMGLPG